MNTHARIQSLQHILFQEEVPNRKIEVHEYFNQRLENHIWERISRGNLNMRKWIDPRIRRNMFSGSRFLIHLIRNRKLHCWFSFSIQLFSFPELNSIPLSLGWVKPRPSTRYANLSLILEVQGMPTQGTTDFLMHWEVHTLIEVWHLQSTVSILTN